MKYRSKPKEYLYNDQYGSKRIMIRTPQCDINTIIYYSPDFADQEWLMIPNYPGYEISDYWNIRSFKYLKQYPLGTLVFIDNNGYCEITDKNNIRRCVSKYQLMQDAKEYQAKHHPFGYPKNTMQGYDKNSARNQRKFIDNEAVRNCKEKGIVRKPNPVIKSSNTLFTPKFTVVEDESKLVSTTLIKPIFFMDSRYNNGENY